MFRKIIKKFSNSKYFMDNKYQNISIQSTDRLGTLSQITQKFKQNDINMVYIKSYFKNTWTDNKKFCLDISIQKQSEQKLNKLNSQLGDMGKQFNIQKPIQVPWFPKTPRDLDLIGKILLDVKDQVNKDHPQFTDLNYRKRRDQIASIAFNHKFGQQIPTVNYQKQQVQLWKRIYSKLRTLHKKGMSKRYNVQMQKLQKQFMFSKRIPQLNQLNSYLNAKTGFNIKPTHGILSQRQFFNCFAFRTFCCTQYLRHTGTPDYTPQPDIVHEIVGHVPMFADPDVAQLSHQIGLLSLGATDQQIAQLGALYWFTMQFGACKQGNQNLGYGAGIASSISQIQNLMSGNCKFQPFLPFKNYKQSYIIQQVQKVYKSTQNFNKALQDLQAFGQTMMKPITTTYNFETKCIQYDRNIEGIDFGDKPLQFV